MAINWHVQRDKTEESPAPPADDGVNPIEGGVIVRHDTDTDMVSFTYYILLRAGSSTGRYDERWRVRSSDRATPRSNEIAISANVSANMTTLSLIPPTGAATSGQELDIAIGAPADPSDAQILNRVMDTDKSVRAAAANHFQTVTRTAFNALVPVSIEAEF